MPGTIELTEEERSYVAQGAAAKAGFLPALLGWLPYLGPVVLFGAYGVAIRDLTAVALAFACLLGLNLWWLHGQSRSAALFRSVCAKIQAAASGRAGPGAPSA
ncbi:hypothetical protein [Bosea minatitlanensis]|uniref:Uncharacterized protein n=1 Tax=Bosea minatitlanensis TaxID=128782 RepID=A0ABW0F9L9_9HYPH|nr:hypothetical protein [Bosea minatitlanensis]MCT4494847.1 hypothetical protein [Bosea minatitlanensis]